jgi:hypothetical protein
MQTIINQQAKIGEAPYLCSTYIECFGCGKEITIDMGKDVVWNDAIKKLRELGWDQREFSSVCKLWVCDWKCMFGDRATRVWEYWRNR